MARNEQFDILVVREIDRLSRNLAKQLYVESELKRNGVRIEYVLGEYADTPEGQFMKNIRAVMAEYERLKIADRATRGKKLKVQAGSTMFVGSAPYGYREIQLPNGHWTLEILPDQAEIVRTIFQWYGEDVDDSAGIVTIAEIAARMTKLGVPTWMDLKRPDVKKRKYGEWSRQTVWLILRNPVYAGRWTYADTGLEVGVPAIIPAELWDKAQARLVYNRKNAPRNVKHNYLLRTRVTCALCGMKMSGIPKETQWKGRRYTYYYYRCNGNARMGLAHRCKQGIFSAAKVDQQVWDWTKSLLMEPDRLVAGLTAKQAEQQKETDSLQDQIDTFARLIAEQRTQHVRLLDLYLTGEFPKDILAERKNRIEGVIAQLELERGRLADQLQGYLVTDEQIENLRALAKQVTQGLDFADTNFDARRRIIEMLDVRGILKVENGARVIYAQCTVDEKLLSFPSRDT